MIVPWRKESSRFYAELGGENCENIINPGRGWYHIYTFPLEDWDKESLAWLPMVSEESLVLLRIDIGAYREEEIPGEAIEYLEKILTFFEMAEKDMILRITYDTEGKGMEREPAFLEQVLAHMRQLGEVLAAHRDGILLCQGLFVGNWGEMHGSKFLGKEALQSLTECFRAATDGKIRLAFRRPVFCRLVGGVAAENGNGNEIGFFDDAIFASANHLGTFGEQENTGFSEPWSMTRELDYLAHAMENVPCGGEAVSGEILPEPQEVVQVLQAMQVTYLNSVYEERLLGAWKETPAPESGRGSWKSLYEYVGAHLGYRFLVTAVRCRGRKEIEIRLRNIGLAGLTEPAELFLTMEPEGGAERRLPVQYELCSLKSGESVRLCVPVPKEAWLPGKVCLTARRKRGDGQIRFANEGAGESLLLGVIR